MVTRIHNTLRVIAFNVNGTGRQSYEPSKKLQDLHVDVALLSETYQKTDEMFLILNYCFYRSEHYPGRKGGTAVVVRKDIPHDHIDLPPPLTTTTRFIRSDRILHT
jgi:hypothetical protein